MSHLVLRIPLWAQNRPAPIDLLQEWKVTQQVNSNRYHEADAIEPLIV